VPWRKVLAWSGVVIAAAVIVVAALYVVFWPLSDVIARHDAGAITGPHRAAALQAARDAARGRLLTLGAGIFAAGALIYTARNFTLSRRTFELTEQGQVTDRYTKAIEQLGSDKLDVRIGGIYALERIARDSARDQRVVMEVLAAFIRERSRKRLTPSANEPGFDAPSNQVDPDVQAALTVIGRRNPDHDPEDVRIQTPAGGLLERPYGVNLIGVYLAKADLINAYLVNATITGAYLARADLVATNLTGAFLEDTNFTGAVLLGADLAGAYLARANFTGADLTDVVITDAVDLAAANFTDAIWPQRTPAPPGWQRGADAARLERAETNSDDAATD
jgi:hypothetical protein